MDHEPVRGGFADPASLALHGLERVRALARGHAPPPPIHHLFGLRPVTVGPAGVTCAAPASPWLMSDAAVFHPGTAALVADAALAMSIQVTLPAGAVVATSDLSFNFLRPANPDSGQLIARARPIDVGDSLGLAEAVVEDARGRLLAHATTRCFVIRLPVPPASEAPALVPAPSYDTPDPYQRPAPPPGAAGWGERPVIDVVNAKRRGELPLAPCCALLGCFQPAAEEGSNELSLRATPWLAGPSGVVYGGVLALFLDIVLTGAATTVLAPRSICSPLDLKVQFIRPVWPDGRRLRATARVDHRGRRLVAASGRVVNENGAVVALATSSLVIIAGATWGALTVADDAPVPGDDEDSPHRPPPTQRQAADPPLG